LSAAHPHAGGTFGKYKLDRLLGKGGMGEVYEAYDTNKNRTVALKILTDQNAQDESFRARFLRESHAAAVLQEPHVIPIHDWGEIDGTLYIDMRMVRGQTLYDLLKKGPLEPERAVAIIEQIAAALDAAHAEGLIHRDVKPQNIIVTPAGFAYLVDFGIAEAKGETHLTRTGYHVGTFKYMAPERFTDQETTPAVDVYSLACVLYEALTGHTPFPGHSHQQAMAAHMSSPPPRPSATNPRVSASFDDVIARGMAKEPDDRYGSAGALGRAAQRELKADARAPSQAATMAAPTAASPAPGPMRSGPQWGPRPAGSMGIGAQQAGNRSGQWVLPTVIGVAATLLLGAIGVIVVLLAKQNPAPAPNPAPTTGATAAPTFDQGSAPSSQQAPPSPVPPLAPPPPAPAVRPPLIEGPDNSASHQSCDYGYSLNNITGWGSHVGRGTPETSCYFAGSVLTSYWNGYGNASRQLRTVSAPGAVGCNTVPGAVCDGSNFLMQCVAYGSDNWITCTGGHNARVYLY
jgi:predicted Ser/Thr protein kinase